MPSDILANFWKEIHNRKCEEVNALSYTTAIAFDNWVAEREGRRRLDCKRWLPYDLSEGDKPRVSPEAIAILERVRESLPGRMLVDLYKHKIINPRE